MRHPLLFACFAACLAAGMWVGVAGPSEAQDPTALLETVTGNDSGSADASETAPANDADATKPDPDGTQDAVDTSDTATNAAGDDFAFAPTADIEFAEDLADLNFAKLARDIWNFQIFVVNGEAITIGKLATAFLVLLLGLWFAKRVARLFRSRLGKLKRIDLNAAAVLSRLLYYLLALLVAFIAMDLAGIPLTVFTVLGGAIAIGIGFGVQTLFNNLISSLILMVERPIRLGDIVVVDEHEGKIEDIGNRCTRLRRSDGVDILIPNSYFLEQAVINWTLLDNDVRGKVAVGVAYGSDTQLTRELILKATHEHGRIKDNPEAVVLFQEFGDNSLNFEVWFWVTIRRPLELRQVESDLRFRIDALFREAGIEIAFPQRDVHLDVVGPVEVKQIAPSAE